MTAGRLALAGLLVATSLAGCLGSPGEPLGAQSTSAEASGEQIAFERVHAPAQIADAVQALGERPGVDVERIGTSLEGRPIHLATVGSGEFELWIVGRQHGNEPTGGEAILLSIEALADPNGTIPAQAPQIVHAFREHRSTLLDRITFHFVPVANPDGAAAYQRGTATGADPNRDHFLFTHPFSRALREAFWERRPDACLDLHNEGIGATDYDAFGAEGPLMEAETYDLLREDANLTVLEVDAAGANAGSYNENYRAPSPVDDYPNPTAFHPGTHDVFCTTRGAPGWTPEGAIEGGSNGADGPVFAWSTRLHQVTVAASAFHWAGTYQAKAPDVWKQEGVMAGPVEHSYELEEPANLTLQAVWRETGPPADHNPIPARFTVTTPSGQTFEGRAPAPEAWTSTVRFSAAEPGTYRLSLTGAPVGTYELRAYERAPTPPLATVQRTDGGLTVTASSAATGPVHLELSDVGDPGQVQASAFEPTPVQVHEQNGTVDERLIVEWNVTLSPGATERIDEPSAFQARGPYRFTATSGERLQTGIEDAFNPTPDG